MALSRTTQDHDEIRQWAEKRGAKPAEVASTHSAKEPGILRFCFPNAPHHNDGSLREIEWDEFFQKFDENGLELVYQDVTAEGAESNFNKLIYPTDDNHSSRHGKSTGSASSSSHAGGKSSGTHAKSASGSSKSSGSHTSKAGETRSTKSGGSGTHSKSSGTTGKSGSGSKGSHKAA